MPVSDEAWNPALDAPYADANPNVTFIGDYFGLAASPLGFFPFWTDTRTGIQEMFIARVSVYPADLYLRDGLSDVGDVPEPDPVFWESPDIVVRHQPDGDTNFVDQGLLRDGVTNHYGYGRVTNRGPNDTAAATLAVTVGNYPSLLGLPGGEFWYPQDWYPHDWSTPALAANHLYLGESAPLAVPNGQTVILGPVLWPAGQIPLQGTWHPCLLGEVRCGNDDSAGGTYGADIPADPADTCPHGSFVYGNNNVCQRNLTYVTKHRRGATRVQLPFVVGSVWDAKPRVVEVTVDKGRALAEVPMTLRMEGLSLPGTGGCGGGGGRALPMRTGRDRVHRSLPRHCAGREMRGRRDPDHTGHRLARLLPGIETGASADADAEARDRDGGRGSDRLAARRAAFDRELHRGRGRNAQADPRLRGASVDAGRHHRAGLGTQGREVCNRRRLAADGGIIRHAEGTFGLPPTANCRSVPTGAACPTSIPGCTACMHCKRACARCAGQPRPRSPAPRSPSATASAAYSPRRARSSCSTSRRKAQVQANSAIKFGHTWTDKRL